MPDNERHFLDLRRDKTMCVFESDSQSGLTAFLRTFTTFEYLKIGKDEEMRYDL